jgi:hypothetical protein
MPEDFLHSFLIFALCVNGAVFYVILRSRWHGWILAGAIFVSMYGISTVASQVESVPFLSNKLPQGMTRAVDSRAGEENRAKGHSASSTAREAAPA